MPIELELDQVINTESGYPLVVNWASTGAYIIPMLDGSASLNGDMIERSGPVAFVSMADVELLELEAGDAGDTITIKSIDYTVLAIDPDGHGGALLRLEEQP